MVIPDLFEFTYVPGWYLQLDELADMALPEIWRFKKPEYIYKNEATPIRGCAVVIFRKRHSRVIGYAVSLFRWGG